MKYSCYSKLECVTNLTSQLNRYHEVDGEISHHKRVIQGLDTTFHL